MAHLGILCPASPGHLYSMCALGRALQGRGHRVTLFQVPLGEPTARAAGIGFHPIGEAFYTPEVLASYYAKLGRLKGLAAMRWTMEIMRRRAAMVLREAPDALRSAKVDGLVVDQVSLEGLDGGRLAGPAARERRQCAPPERRAGRPADPLAPGLPRLGGRPGPEPDGLFPPGAAVCALPAGGPPGTPCGGLAPVPGSGGLVLVAGAGRADPLRIRLPQGRDPPPGSTTPGRSTRPRRGPRSRSPSNGSTAGR